MEININKLNLVDQTVNIFIDWLEKYTELRLQPRSLTSVASVVVYYLFDCLEYIENRVGYRHLKSKRSIADINYGLSTDVLTY